MRVCLGLVGLAIVVGCDLPEYTFEDGGRDAMVGDDREDERPPIDATVGAEREEESSAEASTSGPVNAPARISAANAATCLVREGRVVCWGKEPRSSHRRERSLLRLGRPAMDTRARRTE
jgi:hypothetical protein